MGTPVTPPPPLPKRRDSRSAGYIRRTCQYPSGFISWGYTRGRAYFQVRHGEGLKKCIVVDGGIRTHDPKTHGPSTTPFVKAIVWGHRVSSAGRAVERVLGEYSIS